MDKDHDNRLGDNDFSQSVREDPLLLSCFGQIFPNSRVCLSNTYASKKDRYFRVFFYFS